MTLVVRTWNLFHGRTAPQTRSLHLATMVRLIADGDPDVVGLQEIPVWGLRRLEKWSGMRAIEVVTMPALGGPLARRVTDLDPVRLRSLLTGQGNAVLLGPRVEVVGESRSVRLNPKSLRRTVDLPARRRREWAWNQRLAQVVNLHLAGMELVLVNLHASKAADLATVELDRFADALPSGAAVVVGDLNVPSTTLPGFSQPIEGIDQILVRDLDFDEAPRHWPAERRRVGGHLLSDHAPVEATVRLGSPVR